jgi:hypothetical protein
MAIIKILTALLTLAMMTGAASAQPLDDVSRSTKQPPARVVNEAVVRKLCPNPNAKCMARDNPDFYKDADPAFYNRITKPAGSR